MLNLIAFILMLLASFFAMVVGMHLDKMNEKKSLDEKRVDDRVLGIGTVFWLILFVTANVLFIWS
jgi:hypothetical protein